jgi:hypothetical protein
MSDSRHQRVLYDLPSDFRADEFWLRVELPFQAEDDEVQFVNPVVAAEWFAQKTQDIAYLNGLAEAIEEEVANLKVHRRRAEHAFAKFRRRLLASNYAGITKSADKEIQAAFLLKIAEQQGKLDELETHEEEIEQIVRMIEVREPRRDQFYARLKAIKDSVESAKQYLDFSKLEMRLAGNTSGGRF